MENEYTKLTISGVGKGIVSTWTFLLRRAHFHKALILNLWQALNWMPFLTPVWGTYFWLIQDLSITFGTSKVHSRVRLRLLRVSLEKQPKTLDAIICQLCSGTLTIVHQRRAMVWGGKISKIHSQHLHVFCWSMLEMFPSGQHCFSNVALWEQGFLVKGPLQTSDTWNILIFCQSDTNLIFF